MIAFENTEERCKEEPLMPRVPADSDLSILRRAIELWPYLFIIISITGLTYIALTGAR